MKLLKRVLEKEAGQALPMALILLVLGGLLVVPTLSFMNTNLTANRMVDQANLELYAADAGVENMLWNIQDDPGILPAEGEENKKTINLEDQTINNMSTVETTITNLGNHIYRITSTATNPRGHKTKVEAFLECLNFTHLLEGAITSNGDVTIHNSTINGQIFYADDIDITGSTYTDEPSQETQTNWPTWEDLSPFYWDDVQGHDYTGPNPLLINTMSPPRELGPLYEDGSLTIDNGNTTGLTLKLTGTIYVEGNLIFAQPNKAYTIDLNGQTIFVHGTEGAAWAIDFPSNSVKMTGSGCIIADGNIRFMPGMTDQAGEYVLVMSLSGETYMKPGGDFYGSLVGSAEVDMSNSSLTWTDPQDEDLNFPGMEIGGIVPSSGAGTILSYTISTP
jgi:hypothetical protein